MQKKLPLLLLFFFPLASIAQIDSSKHVGTIKIVKHIDPVYIKTTISWKIAQKAPTGDFSFTSYSKMNKKTTVMEPQAGKLLTVLAPSPQESEEVFDFTKYFQSSSIIKEIKLRKEESDEVTIYFSVNKFGRVYFTDALQVEKLGDTMVVYADYTKQKFKVDVVHMKTKKAFAELTSLAWRPAKIKELKKHPSKRKVKYKIYKGYSEGTLTVNYSTVPFKE